GARTVRQLDQAPVRLARVETSGGPLPRPQTGEPAGGGVGVVRARERDRVGAMILEPMRVAPADAEGPEEDDHARQAELVPQPVDRRRDVSEVFGDHGQVAELALDGAEELGAGAGPPAATLGRRVLRRDRPIGDEATEVIDAT